MLGFGYIIFFLDFTELLVRTNMDPAQTMIYACQTGLLHAMIFIALGIYAVQQIKDVMTRYRQVKEKLR